MSTDDDVVMTPKIRRIIAERNFRRMRLDNSWIVFVLILATTTCYQFQPVSAFHIKMSSSRTALKLIPTLPWRSSTVITSPVSQLRSSLSSSQSRFSSYSSTCLNALNNDDVTDTDATAPISTIALGSDGVSTDVAPNFDDATTTAMYKTAVTRTLCAVAFSCLFGFSVANWMGPVSGEEFFAGYLVEQSLSVDNLFVFLLLFDYFQVPLQFQNRVLNYGIGGAVVFRGVMITLGSAVLHRFKPVLLVFAAILVYSSATALFPSTNDSDEEEDMSDNAIVKFSKSLFPTTDSYDGENFFTQVDGVKTATPLLLCLVAIEISDIVFAVDSIPAVFGVTEDTFIVFTSNMCAILGLRSVYTILSKAASDLEYLEPSVAVVLGFIGTKMVAEYFGYCLPTSVALIVVASLLAGGIGLSLFVQDDNKEGETAGEVDK